MFANTFFTRLCIFLFAAIIAGCGFQLRGTAAKPDYLQKVYVAGQGQFSDFIRELKAKLKNQGVDVVEDAATANLTLTIIEKKEEQRVLTITRTERTDQYQLINTVKFKVTADGAEVLPEKIVTAERVYLYDRYAIIGKDYEKEMLQKEMRQDTIDQIMIRLYAITENDIANAAAPTATPEQPEAHDNMMLHQP